MVVGHGLLDKLRSPFRAITAKVLVIAFAPGATAGPPGGFRRERRAGAPLVAGEAFRPSHAGAAALAAVPGWDAERLGERLFDDVSVCSTEDATLVVVNLGRREAGAMRGERLSRVSNSLCKLGQFAPRLCCPHAAGGQLAARGRRALEANAAHLRSVAAGAGILQRITDSGPCNDAGNDNGRCALRAFWRS